MAYSVCCKIFWGTQSWVTLLPVVQFSDIKMGLVKLITVPDQAHSSVKHLSWRTHYFHPDLKVMNSSLAEQQILEGHDLVGTSWRSVISGIQGSILGPVLFVHQ